MTAKNASDMAYNFYKKSLFHWGKMQFKLVFNKYTLSTLAPIEWG